MFTLLGYKDIDIIRFEFVAKTLIPSVAALLEATVDF